MGKLFGFIILVLVGVVIYLSWPEIRGAMAPKRDPSRPDKVVEGLQKMEGVFTGKNDAFYHCSRRCPERIGGTSSPTAREKADALGLEPCDYCCER